MELLEKLKLLPECPGVYLMRDSVGIIIYVGKSKNLKKRVSSYFSDSDRYTSKLENLMRNLHDFEYITTDTEFEALLLECDLIHQHKPAYNRQMKNPNSYCYIKIDSEAELPEVKIAWDKDNTDGCIYYGPYNSKSTLQRALQTAKESLGILCTVQARKSSPCLNGELGLCNGICFGKTSPAQYRHSIQTIIGWLDGTCSKLMDGLETQMNLASEAFDFEAAAVYRDKLSSLQYVAGRSKISACAKSFLRFLFFEPLSTGEIKFVAVSNFEIVFTKKYSPSKMDCMLETATLIAGKLSHGSQELMPHTEEKYMIDKLQIINAYLNRKSSVSHHFLIDETFEEAVFTEWLHELLSHSLLK